MTSKPIIHNTSASPIKQKIEEFIGYESAKHFLALHDLNTRKSNGSIRSGGSNFDSEKALDLCNRMLTMNEVKRDEAIANLYEDGRTFQEPRFEKIAKRMEGLLNLYGGLRPSGEVDASICSIDVIFDRHYTRFLQKTGSETSDNLRTQLQTAFAERLDVELRAQENTPAWQKNKSPAKHDEERTLRTMSLIKDLQREVGMPNASWANAAAMAAFEKEFIQEAHNMSGLKSIALS
jgi:hypothetical protein